MTEQSGRQPFRFRLPWGMSAPPTAPRPPPQPQTTQSGRPPFRPPGLAPSRPSSQPQAPTRSEPQPPTIRVSSQPSSPVKTLPSQPQAPIKPESRPPSPIRTAAQSRVTSQPSSPSKTAPSQIKAPAIPELQSPSPIPTSPKSRVLSQPPSPSRTTISQTPTTTDSQPSSPHLETPKSQIPLQPPSPSHTTKPQGATRTSSQSSSPSLASTQPQRASQPPSPLQLSSRLPTKTSSQPPSPTRLASQLESAPQKASQDHSPLIQATKSPTQSKSPERPWASLNELASTKRTPSGLEVSERLRQIFQETERSSSKTYQPDLETKQTSGPSAVPIGPSQYSEPKNKPDEIKGERMKPKMQEKEDISTILIEDERRRMTTLELTQGASDSNIQSRGQMGTSEDEKKLQKMQAGIHENNVPAKVAAGEERKPVVPNTQNEKQTDHSIHHKEIRDDISRFAHKMSQKTIDENPVSVMTLAGENTGATMHLGSESPKRESSVHINRGYKLNQEDISEATTDGENSAKRKFNGPKTKEDTACVAYINSNTQSVNNSIMMNSSINERSPGVHVVFTHYPDQPMESNRKTDSVEARKADFNVSQSQKLTYEPTVRRRCLRGLLLESSDSDPDNPEKPRRHGCRYSCNEKQTASKRS